ncbi:MAG: UDP-N-acetylglucosamine 1-carboxyvinyltransferase [Pseudomonadota bacterium]|nr:UDP-N-acetylglucosamine 1-carboxyvinyltransferase [Pseudomonadota bacterium]MEC7094684.1 UDP-N-acetylglucosamine 1-carboxyvinyltransferase [Pseudomonadota bacterium]MEC8129652.1 UDP-N-acetylglucosamine 1-carboxyvinyltransferase [Pseudomonadota bacterium]MEC8538927.1 UDP-N-acetylglucosamine 1-carboxyvinyltransferase [Pseudomonadota bacterium]MEC9145061.1 UDP-N-acetylglucosamine 1-carboxyvinyltransferase [Pseudomonadota bacterium]
MDRLKIDGGVPLTGEISISGAKNAALPLMAAGLVTDGTLRLTNVPDLVDTRSMEVLLRNHGLDVTRNGDVVEMSGDVTNIDAPYDLVRKMRASILVLGPLLARHGQARVSLPGGCAIGTRPVDLHIRAMQALGAVVELADGYIQARAPSGLTGARVVFPMVSVGATENALIAATLAKGTSELVNVAREPEIMDLAECLNAMGARITGHGTDMITVEGVESLGDAEHAVIPDRIEAGTFAIAALITGGDLTLTSARPRHLDSLLEILKDTGAAISVTDNSMRIAANGVAKAADITTDPYPGFPTDLQAQFMALMCLAEGPSRISETVFENRFMHVPELMRMGADIRVDGGVAMVKGRKTLTPAPVMATDLRASVSLVLAALATEGTSEVSRIYHLDRGYSDLEAKLGACGARMKRVGD